MRFGEKFEKPSSKTSEPASKDKELEKNKEKTTTKNYKEESIGKETYKNDKESESAISEKSEKEMASRFIDSMTEIENIWDDATMEIAKLSDILGTPEVIPMLNGKLDVAKHFARNIDGKDMTRSWCKTVLDRLNIFLDGFNFAIDRMIVEINKKGLIKDTETSSLLSTIAERKKEITQKAGEMKKLLL